VQQIFQNLLGSNIPGDFAFADSTQNGQLSQPRPDTDKQKKVGYWLIMLIEKGTGDKEGQVNVRAMLLSSEEEAQSIKDQLTQITDPTQLNTEFSTLANEKSQYDTGGQNGGLIGFISEGSNIGTEFDKAAFALSETGAISDPVKDISKTTNGGFWLVKVLDSATDKEVSTDDINTIISDMFSSWFSQEQAAATIDYLLNETNMYWAISKVTGS
jgi:parvulin-like peptidyl-prolyl isomerase